MKQLIGKSDNYHTKQETHSRCQAGVSIMQINTFKYLRLGSCQPS